MYKKFEINEEKYTDAKVYTITLANRKLFWVRMHDVQEGFGVKNYNHIWWRKKFMVLLRLKMLQNTNSESTKRCEKELDDYNSTFLYVRSYLMLRIIKNCTG